ERPSVRCARGRLREVAAVGQRCGRGPLADRLRQWLADGHGRSAGFAASLRPRPPGHTAAQSPRVRAFGATRAILAAEGWFTEWHEGQPASVGTANHCGVRPRASPTQHGPTCFELEIPMTLPGPDVPHRWQGRTLVDHHGEPLGSIEIIYLDKATEQPEWALLEAGTAGPARTFVLLVSASEEGDTIRVPFDKALAGGRPALPAEGQLPEDGEGELYRHYGVPYSRADSPTGLPAGEPEPDAEPALSADEPAPAQETVSASIPEVTAARAEVTTEAPPPHH